MAAEANVPGELNRGLKPELRLFAWMADVNIIPDALCEKKKNLKGTSKNPGSHKSHDAISVAASCLPLTRKSLMDNFSRRPKSTLP